MNKIYTKKGDKGTTSLLNGILVSKANAQIIVCNIIDKINSWLGLIANNYKIPKIIRKNFFFFMKNLFSIAAEISYMKYNEKIKHLIKYYNYFISNNQIIFIEEEIDKLEKINFFLKNFILPIGNDIVCGMHILRCYVRELENILTYLLNNNYNIRVEINKYCNRLSDFLFLSARFYNFNNNINEIKW